MKKEENVYRCDHGANQSKVQPCTAVSIVIHQDIYFFSQIFIFYLADGKYLIRDY